MAKTTHKQRALKMLESLGWTVADVEKWIPRTNIRVDLFGFADLLAVKGTQTLAVQATSINDTGGGEFSRHVAKMIAEPRLGNCLDAGWLVELWAVRNTPTKSGQTVRIASFELLDEDILVCESSDVLITSEQE